MDRQEMERLTGHTDNISEKIRILYRAGVERSEIAHLLDRRYQQVQNVLKRSGLLVRPEPASASEQEAIPSEFVVLTLDVNRRVNLPAEFVSKAGLSEGDELIATVEPGKITIMSREQAASLLLEAALRHMPGQADLLGALLRREKRSRGS